MADMAIDEVNKVRVSLGMKPLLVPGGGLQFKDHEASESSSENEDDPGSTLESRQAEGYDNWKKLQDEKDAKAKREAKAGTIKKARDAAQKYSLLDGKGLGDANDAGDVDAKTWIQQSKKRRKIEEKKRKKWEQEVAEREASAAEYTAADLAGVKVAHEVDDFEGGGEQVLTLKDATIDQYEEDGDELENIDLRDQTALKERLDVKKKKSVYDPSANEAGTTVLQQYDEVIDGKKRKRFTLDGQGASLEARQAIKEAVGERLKRQQISLDLVKESPSSDYKEGTEPKIKKPKKSKGKSKRQKAVDEDDDDLPANGVASADRNSGDAMIIDDSTASRSVQKLAESFADDDDLQASLAAQRRAALKKRKKTKPEDLARQLREEALAMPGEADPNGTTAEDGTLIIDETTEFVANLQRTRQEEEESHRSGTVPKDQARVKQEYDSDEDRDVDMQESYNEVEERQDLEERMKRETSAPNQPVADIGIEEEATLSKGLGSTLNLLSERGLLKRNTEQDSNHLLRDRQRFLAEKQKRESDLERKARLQRERDRASGKLEHMSAREREEYARYENKQRDQAESRIMSDVFNREYKPDVQLKYVDEFGRHMNQKEAFKHLSHQFHGKGSGKQKTEKHLKKIDDTKKRESQSMLDVSEAKGMNNAMGATAKKNRQAGVRLA